MEAKARWLKEKNNIIIPKTLDSQTFDSDGNSLAERLRGIDDTEVIQLPKVDPTLIVSDLDYSTEEQLTGKRWIDGKPIYQKTLCGTSTSGLFQIDLSSLNIDKFLNPSLNWMKNENGNKDVIGDSYYGSSSDFFRYYFSEDSILKIESGSGYSHGDFYLTIQYTKTTDTADSPVDMPVVDKLPFKFGIDENGNYGYIKVGADTVTPFKSGDGGGYTIANGDFEKLFETRVATVPHIIDKNYDEYLMELSLERNSQFMLEDSTLVVGSDYSDITCKNGDGNRVVYNYKTGLINLPDGGYGISNGEPVNPRADVAYKWIGVLAHLPSTDIYTIGECYIIRSTAIRTASVWFVTSDSVTSLQEYQVTSSGLIYGPNRGGYRTYGKCHVFVVYDVDTVSWAKSYSDYVLDTDNVWGWIESNLSLFTDEDGNFVMKNPWKVTMYGKKRITKAESKLGSNNISTFFESSLEVSKQ